MAVEVKWLELDHVLGIKMQGQVERIAFMQMDDDITHKLKTTVSPQVHLIFDCSDLEGLPGYEVYRDALFMYEHRLGWGVAFGNNSITPYFINNFMTMHEMYFHMCTSFSDALQFLMMVDVNLGQRIDLSTLYSLIQ